MREKEEQQDTQKKNITKIELFHSFYAINNCLGIKIHFDIFPHRKKRRAKRNVYVGEDHKTVFLFVSRNSTALLVYPSFSASRNMRMKFVFSVKQKFFSQWYAWKNQFICFIINKQPHYECVYKYQSQNGFIVRSKTNNLYYFSFAVVSFLLDIINLK